MVVGSALGTFAVARPPLLLLLRGQKTFKFRPLSSSSAEPSRKLVLYSKPGCCLCDGLKEKLQTAFLLSGPDSLHDVDLQASLSLYLSLVGCTGDYEYEIRDITSNPDWESAYQYEIPVLAKVLSDGTELHQSWLKRQLKDVGDVREMGIAKKTTQHNDWHDL
ncbi:hypothetical protein CR513_47241, partial [Mucuna pruriens]